MADNWTELNGGEDDEALRMATTMSLDTTFSMAADLTQTGSENGDKAPRMEDNQLIPDISVLRDTGAHNNTPPAATNFLSSLGMNRKRMDQERLARLSNKKRNAIDIVDEDRPLQRQKTDEDLPRSLAVPRNPSQSVQQTHQGLAQQPSPLPFPHGVVKRTWAFRQPRLGDDIKIEEVLQKDELLLAVLSSFQWDDQWIMSKFAGRTKLMLIAYAENEDQRKEIQDNAPGNVRFCFPSNHGGCMHSKLMLLKFQSHLRLVIPTGNLTSHDWGETGVLENLVFLIDLPRLPDRDATQNKLPLFGEDLVYFLQAQGLDNDLIRGLYKYNFSATSRYGFVHTIAGSHLGEGLWQMTGYPGLGRTVNALGLSSDGPIDIDYVSSSLGALNHDILRVLYSACQGKVLKTKNKNSSAVGNATLDQRVRIYFPSQDTVTKSRGGKDGAGTICFRPEWWQAPQCPRAVMRDSKSTRAGLLLHSKVLYARQQQTDKAFAYIGSSNLSESAWGRVVQDRATAWPKLTCRNWECGVLIQTGDRSGDMSATFAGSVPVPIMLPGAPLNASNPPWFFQLN